VKKIQSEVWIVVTAVFFVLSWLIDKLGGPVKIVVKEPVAFLKSSTLLHTYPFTATAIIIRTIAIFLAAMVILSFIRGKYFTKAIALFFVGILGEFYAIQQLATGSHLTTIQWTLSIAYGSLTLILGIIWMVLKGIWATFNKSEENPPSETQESESILDPKKDD